MTPEEQTSAIAEAVEKGVTAGLAANRVLPPGQHHAQHEWIRDQIEKSRRRRVIWDKAIQNAAGILLIAVLIWVWQAVKSKMGMGG